jgi:hypothetical protein
MDAGQVRAQYIFAPAVPLVGWIVFFCAVVGGAGLSVIGTVVGLSFIYLLGLPVAVLIYCVDRQMIMRSLPLWSSSLVCLVVGGMLSLVLLRFFPLRMGLDRPGV